MVIFNGAFAKEVKNLKRNFNMEAVKLCSQNANQRRADSNIRSAKN